jgi:hypothetical protein
VRSVRVSATFANDAFAGPLVEDLDPVLLRGEVDGDEADEGVSGQVGGDGPRGAAHWRRAVAMIGARAPPSMPAIW